MASTYHPTCAKAQPTGQPKTGGGGIREYWLRQYGTGHDEVTPKGIAVITIGGGAP